MYETFFKDRLIQLIAKAGVSESKMSRDLHFDRSYINNLTSGRSLPHMKAFFSICDYLHVTPDEFFHREEAQRDTIEAVEQAFLRLDDQSKLSLVEVVRQLQKVK